MDDNSSSDLGGLPPWLTQVVGMSMIASYLPGYNSGVARTLMIFMMGWLLEMGRRAYGWLSERWRFQYSLTAEFTKGDPAYDWITAFLAKEQVWRDAWNFKICAKTLQRKGGVEDLQISQGQNIENAEYVPTYQKPQLFRWNGHWIEIRRTDSSSYDFRAEQDVTASVLYLTVYTRDVTVVSALVEEARAKYVETTNPHVIIHSSNVKSYSSFYWTDTKRKLRRPLDSVILEPGVIDSLVDDAREFLDMEDWYHVAGIPYRRGYLLYGPPGTGKSSTIYALAGELGLEIYSLSLASSNVDDAVLAQAVGSIPRRSIFLLEDIDCAFSRSGDMNDDEFPPSPYGSSRCSVTLSGLLNTLDGVASQEGVLFFATTNHIEDLDSALLRPGRVDRKIQYHYSAKEQAVALFIRFFPISYCTPESAKEGISDEDKTVLMNSLADKFAEEIPEKTFTTAELQGFLLTCKFKPEKAVKEAKQWASELKAEKEELERVKKEKREKMKAKRDLMEVAKLQSTLQKMNDVNGSLPGTRTEGSPIEPPKIESPSEAKTSKLDDNPLLVQDSGPTCDKEAASRESDSESWTVAGLGSEEDSTTSKRDPDSAGVNPVIEDGTTGNDSPK